MKQPIDNLVRAIHHARARPLPADAHLAEFFLAWGLDGPAPGYAGTARRG